MAVKTPAMDERCAVCQQPFGSHYETFNGKYAGVHPVDGPVETIRVDCPGFAQTFRSRRVREKEVEHKPATPRRERPSKNGATVPVNEPLSLEA